MAKETTAKLMIVSKGEHAGQLVLCYLDGDGNIVDTHEFLGASRHMLLDPSGVIKRHKDGTFSTIPGAAHNAWTQLAQVVVERYGGDDKAMMRDAIKTAFGITIPGGRNKGTIDLNNAKLA